MILYFVVKNLVFLRLQLNCPFSIDFKTKNYKIEQALLKVSFFFLCYVSWGIPQGQNALLSMLSILQRSSRNTFGPHPWYPLAWPAFILGVFLIYLILTLLKLDLWKRVVFLCPYLSYITLAFVSENFI